MIVNIVSIIRGGLSNICIRQLPDVRAPPVKFKSERIIEI